MRARHFRSQSARRLVSIVAARGRNGKALFGGQWPHQLVSLLPISQAAAYVASAATAAIFPDGQVRRDPGPLHLCY
jgi:hypothetical protein